MWVNSETTLFFKTQNIPSVPRKPAVVFQLARLGLHLAPAPLRQDPAHVGGIPQIDVPISLLAGPRPAEHQPVRRCADELLEHVRFVLPRDVLEHFHARDDVEGVAPVRLAGHVDLLHQPARALVRVVESVDSKGLEAALAIEANVLADARADVEHAPKPFAVREVDNGLGKRRVKVVAVGRGVGRQPPRARCGRRGPLSRHPFCGRARRCGEI